MKIAIKVEEDNGIILAREIGEDNKVTEGSYFFGMTKKVLRDGYDSLGIMKSDIFDGTQVVGVYVTKEGV